MFKIGTLILFCFNYYSKYIYFKYVVVGSIRDTAKYVFRPLHEVLIRTKIVSFFLTLNVEIEPHRRHCVVVLEQDTFILAKDWFNPGRPIPV